MKVICLMLLIWEHVTHFGHGRGGRSRHLECGGTTPL